jgi:peptide/nickel transport system permease protein
MFLGIIAGLTPGRLADNVISVGTLMAVSTPEFVSGTVLIFVFGVWLAWFPPSSLIDPGHNPLQSTKYLVLPVATLTLKMLAHISRMTRAGLIEVMQTAYIRAAYLKGLPSHVVILKHALRNALPPTITVIASFVGWLVGGLIIVETVFTYPGIGRLLVLAIVNRDVPLLEATGLTIAAFRVGSNFVADMLYAYLDPQIRY